MEQDNYIKQVLLNSAEGASINFTDAVLKRIRSVSGVRRYDQALVAPKWQRLFLYTFGFTVLSILILCLVIAAAHTEMVNWIKRWALPEIDYYTVLIFILCFWIVFAVNAFVEKKFPPAQRAFNAHGE